MKRSILIMFLCLSCCNKPESIEKKAVITSVGYKHWGRGYYKQIVHYDYYFNNTKYSATKETGREYGILKTGDTIVVRFYKNKPDKSTIEGKLPVKYDTIIHGVIRAR